MGHCATCKRCGMEIRPRIDGPCQAMVFYEGSLQRCLQPRGQPYGDRPEHKYEAGFDHIVSREGPCVCGHWHGDESCKACLEAAWEFGMISIERAVAADHPYLGATIDLDHEAE